MLTFPKPMEGQFAPYFKRYIDFVGENDVISILRMGSFEMVVFLENLTEEQWQYAYEPGKWTIMQVLNHMLDVERIFAYRALCIARNDKTSFPSFDHDAYVADSDYSNRSAESMIAEYKAVREATIHLLEGLNKEARQRVGTASGHTFSVSALAYMIAGHEIHHMELFKTKYLK